MKDLQTLQDRLNDRADKKLNHIIDSQILPGHAEGMYASSVSIVVRDGIPELGGQYLLEKLRTALFERYRDEYRAAETREFLEKIDEIRAQISDLENQVLG